MRLGIIIACTCKTIMQGVRGLLTSNGCEDESRIAWASSEKTLLQKLRFSLPGILFIEDYLDGADTREIIHRVSEMYRSLRIVAFCIGNCLERKAAGLVRWGADSFLDLRRDAGETGRAVRRILCGKDYVPSGIAKIVEELDRCPDDGRPLTRQQLKIFKLTLFCMKRPAMSKLLRLSEHTIKMHRRNISLKCGGGRYIEWFFYGLRHNLITLEEIREHWQEERGCNEVLD